MDIKILYDNSAADGFESGWGFSALINDHILFDTGENESSLMANMKSFGISPEQIDKIVISHSDWDHIGGIGILRHCGPVNVYLPSGASGVLKEKLARYNQHAIVFDRGIRTALDANTHVTQTMVNRKREISLTVTTPKGIVLITGCAHPGLENILECVGENGPVYAVIGGFHGFTKIEALRDVELIIPCHCTKHTEAICVRYPTRTHTGYAGAEFVIE